LDANQEQEREYCKELEEKIEKLMTVNHIQQHEIERLGKLAWETLKNAQVTASKPFPLHIDTKDAMLKTYYQPIPSILTRSAMEDVVMTYAYPAKCKRDFPMFNGEKGDVESFIYRLKRYFGRDG